MDCEQFKLDLGYKIVKRNFGGDGEAKARELLRWQAVEPQCYQSWVEGKKIDVLC